MDLIKLSKKELLEKCKELGFTKYKSQNKSKLHQPKKNETRLL